MREEIIVRLRTRLLVFGAWTVLMVVLGFYHWWRIAPGRMLDGAVPPFLPMWLLLVDGGLIVAGFVLVSVRKMAGNTPMGRYWASLYVGVICTGAAGLLVFDLWRHLAMRCTVICCH